MSLSGLPWRGPGPDRPDLPLPPGRLPIRRAGVWRKRWRYVGVFADELIACAARIQVARAGQTFWVIWDRRRKRLWEQTKLRLPGARGEVWTEGPDATGLVEYVSEEGSVDRVEAKHPEAGDVRAFLRFSGAGAWAEAICPAGERGYVWTRKRVGAAVEADVRAGGERWRLTGLGAEDESAGYHPRHTVWSWSAGVGTTADGRAVGWNLVAGVNDPPQRSERAIWIDGEPTEPGPVEFDGLEAIRFDDGARLEFAAECERRKDERRPFIRYTYRQPLGAFSGTLPGGLRLTEGVGVMEHHDAHW
ncbi:MAG: DUF2804 domain-containing protein [Solirubrobacterales bacterium]